MTLSSVPNIAGTTQTFAPATSSAATSTTSGTSSSTGAASIAGNFNTFLSLLTTQLQNQNPLSPLDTNQFTQQLVEFASVEQQMNMNSQLGTLITLQQTSQATSALGFIGATVTVNGNTAQLASGQANWSYAVKTPATATINISNSTGQVVYSTTQTIQAGTQPFTWNGMDSQGNSLPNGDYTAAITATDANGQNVPVTTQVQGVVSGVDVSQNPPLLTIGDQSYPLSQVTQILHAGS